MMEMENKFVSNVVSAIRKNFISVQQEGSSEKRNKVHLRLPNLSFADNNVVESGFDGGNQNLKLEMDAESTTDEEDFIRCTIPENKEKTSGCIPLQISIMFKLNNLW